MLGFSNTFFRRPKKYINSNLTVKPQKGGGIFLLYRFKIGIKKELGLIFQSKMISKSEAQCYSKEPTRYLI